MPTLLDLLYQYAQEQRMGAALSAAGPDFRAACRLAEKARTGKRKLYRFFHRE